jgi:hypothetical protein
MIGIAETTRRSSWLEAIEQEEDNWQAGRLRYEEGSRWRRWGVVNGAKGRGPFGGINGIPGIASGELALPRMVAGETPAVQGGGGCAYGDAFAWGMRDEFVCSRRPAQAGSEEGPDVPGNHQLKQVADPVYGGAHNALWVDIEIKEPSTPRLHGRTPGGKRAGRTGEECLA